MTEPVTANKVIVLILAAIFGLFFLGLGVVGVVLEYQTQPVHTSHLAIFVFFVLLGAVLLPGIGTIIFARLKDGVELARPLLPTFGRRASQGEIAVAPVPPSPKTAEPPETGEAP